MSGLFILFILIDVVAAYYFFKEAFIVRSNMRRKYRTRFVAMVAVIAGALWLKGINLSWACLLAGLPAVALGLFAIGLLIALTLHKGPWR